MKNNLLKFALAASLILNLTVLATAGYHHYQQSRSWVTPLGKVMDRDRFIFEDLSLKPEQLDAMKDKAMRFHGEIDRRRLEIEGKRKELITLLRFDNADQRAVDAVIRDISSSQERMQKMVALHMLEIKGSLEKNQQQKFFDLIEGTMIRSGSAACMPKDGTM
jgi:Spy/CpxP family protein refolding chaperone